MTPDTMTAEATDAGLRYQLDKPAEVPAAAPKVDVPLSEASQDLTGFEVLGIERHFGVGMEDLSGTKMLLGSVWAYESRTRGKPCPWTVPENMTMRELSSYFAAEPATADEDSEQGKG
jgi:hypothetical protein